MKKKKILLVCVIVVLAYVVFALIVKTLFDAISKDPIDSISMTYIRNYTDISDRYGEIIFIGRNVLHKAEKSETAIKRPYTVETTSGDVIVYVNLVKNDGEWKATSYEIIEVRTNG